MPMMRYVAPAPAGAQTGNVIVTVGGAASNGKMFTVPTGTNVYSYLDDMLGSARVITTSAGAVCYDADFYPFGGERVVTDNCGAEQDYKFEGKERDTETGNDNFGARYYSNRLGRWLSADWSSVPAPVPYANLTNPQTLNLYAMVSDNPESFADLDGHCLIDFDCISAVAATVPTAKNYNTTENRTCNGKDCANKTNTGASGEQADQKRITEEAQQKSSGTATFTLGGVTVTFRWATYTESQGRGVEIAATPSGCDSCVWAQTVNGTGIKDTQADIQKDANGNAADPHKYPFTAPSDTPGQLYDRPERSTAPAHLNFVSTMGIAAANTFNVKGSLTWGFSVNKAGQVSFSGVRLATPAEQRGSLIVWRGATGMQTIP